VVVAASPEKARVLGQVAEAYNGENRQVAGECVYVQVSRKGSGSAASALAEGWDETTDGPAPTIWSPSASTWGEIVADRARAADQPVVVPDTFTSVANTPLVVAMPRPMAEAIGWPDAEIGWADLAALSQDPKGWASQGHPEWGRFKLGKTNPNLSTSGLHATVATYFAATGVSSDLTEADVRSPETAEFVARVEQSVVHYGDTTLTFLENLLRADAAGVGLSYISAVTVEEKSVLDYNAGNPQADPDLTDPTPPDVPLVAVYPSEGTLLSDNPFFVLEAPWVDEAQAAAAEDFTAFVLEPTAQGLLAEEGFRGADGTPGARITTEAGLLPAQPATVLGTPSGDVLAAITQEWTRVRKPAEVLIVLDVSGSMAADVEGTGATRLELAQQAVIGAVEEFAPQDQVGFWVFSDEDAQGGTDPWTELVPIGPSERTVPKIQEITPRLQPGGGTALFATTKAAHAALQERDSDEAIVGVVLLTDGENEHSDDDLQAVLDQLETEGTSTGVRVFTIGYGEDADQATLEAIAEASRARSYDVSDPATIEQVMIDVLSNF
jgi:Ca-activated chloride channel family protein